MKKLNFTAHQILDLAEQYTQEKGFHSFSYKDLQNTIGIKTSSIHYYFPTKNDLAFTMTKRYIERFRNLLKAITNDQPCGITHLKKIGETYTDLNNQGKLCLCGMLASELASLSDAVACLINDYFRLTLEWVSNAAQLAVEQGKANTLVNPNDFANLFLATIQGGMLISIAQKNTSGELENLIEKTIKQIEL